MKTKIKAKTKTKKAVILLSGGLDSTTCLAIATHEGYDCYALTIAYGQRNHLEIEHAKRIAAQYGVIEHRVLPLPIGQWGGSALTDLQISVPEYASHVAELTRSTQPPPSSTSYEANYSPDLSSSAQSTSTLLPQQASSSPQASIELATDTAAVPLVPVTYVPARNTIFLSVALAWAEVVGAYDIFIGANSIDYSNYPDCRPEFLHAFEQVANLGTREGLQGERFKLHAPLLHLNKVAIIRRGLALGVDYEMTLSCYNPSAEGKPCGVCDACCFRQEAFAQVNAECQHESN